MKTRSGDVMLGFHPYFRHSAQLGRQSCQLYAPAAFYLQGIPWYSFLLEAEWTPGLLNADGGNRSLYKFKGPCLESNPEPPVLWRSVSNNCAARPTVFLLVMAINFYLLAYLKSIKKRRQFVTIPCVCSLSNQAYF